MTVLLTTSAAEAHALLSAVLPMRVRNCAHNLKQPSSFSVIVAGFPASLIVASTQLFLKHVFMMLHHLVR